MDSLRKRVAERLAVKPTVATESTLGQRSSSYSESALRQYWMPDAVSVECYDCSAKFTTFRRKHHCRVCGQIFCSKCCSIFISGQHLRCSGNLRVCTYCYKKFDQLFSMESVSEAEVSGTSNNVGAGSIGPTSNSTGSSHCDNPSVSGPRSLDTNPDAASQCAPQLPSSPSSGLFDRSYLTHRLSLLMSSSSLTNMGIGELDSTLPADQITPPPPSRKASVTVRPSFFVQSSDLNFDGQDSARNQSPCLDDQSVENESLLTEISLKDPHKLKKLWKQIVSPTEGIPLETVRYGGKLYVSCFSGSSIVQWLQARDPTTWRQQAIGFGQALLDAGYLEDLTCNFASLNPVARFNEFIPYKPAGQACCDDNDFSAENQDVHIDADGPEWLQHVDFPSSHDEQCFDPEQMTIAVPKTSVVMATLGHEMPHFSGFKSKDKRKNSKEVDKTPCPRLDDIYQRHEQTILNKIMAYEKLSSRWTELIQTYCHKVAATIELEPVVDPELKRVNMDIREFVKIKRVPGGNIDDSCIVKGEVFSNQVIRVGMPLTLDNTNVLLVKDSITYAREDRYVSLTNMKLQEEEYTKNISRKITSLNPGLILVEKTICRSVQDTLCQANIPVVLNVKSKVLRRISRYFSTPIVESLGSMVSRPILGMVNRYRSRIYSLKDNVEKNMISLEGADMKKGCTILLRGADLPELAKVKRVLRHMMLVKMHCRYERSFLLHEDVQTDDFPVREKCPFDQLTLSPFIQTRSTNSSSVAGDDEYQRLAGPASESDDADYDAVTNVLVTVRGQPESGYSAHAAEAPPYLQSRLEKAVLTKPADDRDSSDLLSEFRAQCSRRSQTSRCLQNRQATAEVVPDYYLKIESKCIPMLFSSHNVVASNYCIPPWVVKMGFYRRNDIPLGVFLDSFCFDEGYKCPSKNECSVAMKDHIRKFCLGDGNVKLILQTLDAPIVHGDLSSIFMWKYCNDCESMTNIVPLNIRSWMLSFSMFLLLLLQEERLLRRDQAACSHSLHRHQLTCFGKGDLVAFFKACPIQYFRLLAPPIRVTMPQGMPIEDLLLYEFEMLSVKGSDLFGQINSKMVKLKAESLPGSTLDATCADLLQEQDRDLAEYRTAVDHIGQCVQHNALNIQTRKAIMLLKISVAGYYTKWQSKLHLLQELKKKEDKTQPPMSKERVRVNSGNSLTAIAQHSDKEAAASLPTSETSPVNATTSISVTTPNLSGTLTEARPISGLSVHRTLPSAMLPSSSSSTLSGSGTTNSDRTPRKNDDTTSLSGPSRIWMSLVGSPIEFQLTSPFRLTLHPALCVPNRILTVDEAQPSSIIAYTLSTPEYQDFINMRSQCVTEVDSDDLHFKYQFNDETCKFYCCVFFAGEFHKLRRLVLLEQEGADFAASLAECQRWESCGGKSSMTFFKTRDERFILKEMSSFERNSFPDFAGPYCRYISQSHELRQPTLLAKIVGVYKVGYKNSLTGNSLKIDLLIIENLFYQKNISESYDLKGSVRNRLVDRKNTVLMDENLLEVARDRPFYIRPEHNPDFYPAISRDTHFLTEHSMMDYSLLVGIDSGSNDMFIGIIDYIRTFTWDKKLETMVKSSGILGGRGKAPTIIPPKYYQKRFIEAMETYFIAVPSYSNQLLDAADALRT